MKTTGHPSGENFVRAANAAKEVLRLLNVVKERDEQSNELTCHTFNAISKLSGDMGKVLGMLEALAHHAATTEEGQKL